MEDIRMLITAFVGCIGFSLLFHLKKRHIILAALGGVLTWAVYLAGIKIVGGIFFPTLIAGVVATIYGEILARLRKAPATLYLIIAVLPLIPGSTLYYTMSYGVQKKWEMCEYFVTVTWQYALAIAIGMSLVWAVFVMFFERRNKEDK